jgi:hypothetical protein
MPDQELTALRIKIEADVENAIKLLQSLATKVVAVENTVRQSVGKITASLKSIDGKTIGFKVDIQGKEELDNFKKKLNDIKAAAGNTVVGATSGVRSQGVQRKDAVVPSESGISSFVSAVKSGVAVSVEELKKFRTALTTLFESKQLRLGVDNTEVLQLKKDLEFLNGFINASKRDIKVRVSTEGDQEIKNKLNNLQKDYVLRIIPSFNDADFNKLLTEIQNKRINLTFEDVSDAIKEEIRQVESITANLPIGADTSAYDAKVNGLKNSLTKVQAIQVNANTAPAELSLKQLENKVESLLTKGPKIKVETVIITPDKELQKLTALKFRLEQQKIKQTGIFDNSQIIAAADQVQARISELNSLGVNIGFNNSVNAAQATAQVQNAVKLAKEFKAELQQPINVRVNADGIREVGRQAQQVGRSFEQIVRDAPSFAYGVQAGLIAISNNIGPLQDSLQRLGETAKTNQQTIGQALKQTLSGWNGVSLAISLAVTGVVLFSKQLFGANEETKKLKGKFQDIKDIIDSTKFSVPKAIGGIQGDIFDADSLLVIATGLDETKEARDKALGALKALDKNIFKDFGVTIDPNNTKEVGRLTAAVAQYIKTTTAVTGKKTSIADVNKLSAELAVIDKQIEEQIRKVDKIKEDPSTAKPLSDTAPIPATGLTFGAPTTNTTGLVDQGLVDLEKAQVVLTDLQKQARELRANIDKGKVDIARQALGALQILDEEKTGSGSDANNRLKESLGLDKEILEKRLAALKESNKKLVEAGRLSADELQKSVAAELDLEQQIQNVELQIRLVGVESDVDRGKINTIIELERERIENTYGDQGIQIGVATLDTQSIINFTKELEIFRERVREAGITGRDNISGAKQKIELPNFVFDDRVLDLENQINKIREAAGQGLIPQGVFDDILPQMESFNTTAEYQVAVLNKLREIYGQSTESLDAFTKKVSDLNRELANIVASQVADLFGTLFDSLNEDGKLTFEEIGNAVRGFVQDLIKAIGKLLIFKAIISAFGLDSVAAVAGPLIRARKFATGGIVTNATLGMVGEAGPEAVLPLSYLNNLFANNTSGSTPSLALRGSDLYWIWAQENKKNNRFF